MDDLSALRLQIEWGADEALLDAPVDRFALLELVRTPTAPATVAPRPPPPIAPRTALAPPPALAALATQAAAAAMDIASLHAALAGFDACPLRTTASTTVAPFGNPAAGLVLIGEAPGRDDDRSGQAYSGAPGAVLDRVLASAGLGRDDLLLTFLIPWRPPGGREPSEAEVAMCLPFLHRLLALTAPRRLVLLGSFPLRTLAGAAGSLRQARGRWVDVTVPGMPAPVPALPMVQPDLWLKTAGNRQNTWTDLLTLRDALKAD